MLSALVVIETSNSTGTGFFVRDGDDFYVLSNQHVVLKGGGVQSCRGVDGKRFSLKSVELHDELDLARLLVAEAPGAALELSGALPSLDRPVYVFGNSDGAGVFTRIEGSILGVGPDLLEVSAEFVHGNSGSPILDGSGRVCGVATFAILSSDPSDWVKGNSRFGRVRRFGCRIPEDGWVPLSTDEYYALAETVDELWTFLYDWWLVCIVDEEGTEDNDWFTNWRRANSLKAFRRNYMTALKEGRFERNSSLGVAIVTLGRARTEYDRTLKRTDSYGKELRGVSRRKLYATTVRAFRHASVIAAQHPAPAGSPNGRSTLSAASLTSSPTSFRICGRPTARSFEGR